MRKRLFEFTGRDFSLGLRSGRLYAVRLLRFNSLTKFLNHGCKYSAWVKRDDKYMYCLYEGKELFEQNWKQI